MIKKAKTIQFEISNPCAENWNAMHTLPGGRFCDSCEKTVVDFTEMTDNELVRFYQNNNQKLCGRFRLDQVNKEIAIPQPPSSFQKWKSAAAIVAGLLAWNGLNAQNVQLENQPSISIVKSNTETVPSKSSFTILKGIVKDENGEALIGANILLARGKGTVTDIDGKFELKVPSEWETFEVTFSYMGYATQIIEFDKKEIRANDLAEIKMQISSTSLTNVEVVGYGTQSKCVIMGGIGVLHYDVNEEEVKEEEEPEKLKIEISNIYPNPFVDFVNVLLEVDKDNSYLFHLYNINGQLIWAKTYDLAKGNQELRLDFSSVNMAQGNHFLRVTDGNQEIQTKKIIKVNVGGGEVSNSEVVKF